MLFYDLVSIVLISIGHVYLFQLFLGNTNISMRFVLVMSVLFGALLSVLLMNTRLSELNIVAICLFLIVLGLIEKQRFSQVLYFTLLSIVLFTVVKNGLFIILYELYMESPFNYYVWTPNMLQFWTLALIVVGLFLGRQAIATAGRYLMQSRVYWPTYIVSVVCTVLLVIVNYPTLRVLAQLNAKYGEQLYTLVLFTALILITVIALTTYVSKKRLIEQHEQSKQEQLMEYVEKLEFLHDELATFRHDYSNLLLSLEQSIQTNDLAQVKQIYEQTIAPTASVINHQQLELTKLTKLKQPELKSLVSVKVLASQRKGLDLHLDIPELVTFVGLPMEDLLRVVSILIDNAVEESEKSVERLVQVAFFQVEQKQYVVVKNSVGSVQVEVEALYQKSFSTKGTGRGIGLFSVQRIIQKHPHVTLMTKVEEGMFTQELLIKPFVKK